MNNFILYVNRSNCITVIIWFRQVSTTTNFYLTNFQVSMRILEVTLCTLLAVIATTPLRSEFDIGARIAAANGTLIDGGMPYHGDMMMDPSETFLLLFQARLRYEDS